MTTASTPPTAPPPLAIEARNLHYRFPDGTHALRGASFAVAHGDTVGLIGPNGAGKSTLLLHLNGLLPDHRPGLPPGTLFLHGKDLADPSTDLHALRREVGLVFQDPDDQLFCPTVWEDVAFGPQQLGLSKAEVGERVEQALAAMNLQGFERRPPHHLSGGEQRRVCLAGVLACHPRLLILDEPTSNLDPRGRRELKALLKTIPITKIIATHDLELVVELCPTTLLLAHGVIAAAGPTVPMLSDEPLMLKHDLERPHILSHLHPHPPSSLLPPLPFISRP
jgi:cobalt/nickel transport system ATP-binding protein